MENRNIGHKWVDPVLEFLEFYVSLGMVSDITMLSMGLTDSTGKLDFHRLFLKFTAYLYEKSGI